MTPTPLEIGALALIVGMLALAQRLGAWQNRPLARCLGIAASALFGAWCFLVFAAQIAWAATAVIAVIDVWSSISFCPSCRTAGVSRKYSVRDFRERSRNAR